MAYMTLNEKISRASKLPVDIVDLLQDMGLTDKEVEIYEYLLNSGGAIPSAIARDTGQPRGRIYEGMRNLVAKGFARERPTRPILFGAAPLADVLAAAQARLSRHLHAVHYAQAVGGDRLPTGAETVLIPPMRIRDVSVLSGRRACHAEITRMMETASSFFWLAGGGRFAERLSNMPGFLDGVQAAAARGVDVQIVFPETKALGRALTLVDAGRARPLLHQVHIDATEPLVSCATERAALEMVAQPDDGAPNRGDDVAVHIGDPLFAARLKRRIGAMLAAHAPSAAGVYPWLGPNHGSDIFGEAIKRVTGEVQVLGPLEWGTYMSANWEQESPVYDAAMKRGVLLRAIATNDAAADADMERFQESWNIRRVPKLPMWLTILDGNELYQAFPHPSMGGQPRFRHSVEPHEVRFYQQVFERLWESALPTPVARPRLALDRFARGSGALPASGA